MTSTLPPVGQMLFKPNSWAQWRALVSEAPEVLYSGRYGSSKSRTLTEKGDLFCRKYPGARVVLARKRRVDLGLTTLRILLQHTVSPAEVAAGWRKSADGGSSLSYRNGSEILCVGLDEPGKLRSGEFDMILIDQAEEMDEEEWNAASGRLRGTAGPFRQIMGACNPSSPEHFLFKKFDPTRSWSYHTPEDVKLPNGAVIAKGTLLSETILAGRLDNFENLTNDYIHRLERFKGRYYRRYVLGQWVAFEGQVYDCYDAQVHTCNRPKAWDAHGGYPPPSWPRHRGIDFGYVNPFVCQWWAVDPDGCWWLYREIYMTHRTVQEHAAQINYLEEQELAAINATLPSDQPRPRYFALDSSVSDHDAEDRATLDMANIYTAPAIKDVSPGIQTTYALMAPFEVDGKLRTRIKLVHGAVVEVDESLDAEGKPTCTIQEIPLLRYRNPPRSSTVGRAAPEEVFKENDHGCDTMRYVIQTWSAAPRPFALTVK